MREVLQAVLRAAERLKNDRYRREWIHPDVWPTRLLRMELRPFLDTPATSAADLWSLLKAAIDAPRGASVPPKRELHNGQHLHSVAASPEITEEDWTACAKDPAGALHDLCVCTRNACAFAMLINV